MNIMQFILQIVFNAGMEEAGKFFSHDFAGVNADIYTMAKGMGNGFPVAGIFIAPHINQNILCWELHLVVIILPVLQHLLCLEVIEEEKLMGKAVMVGKYLKR